jgi:streptogramin lyase
MNLLQKYRSAQILVGSLAKPIGTIIVTSVVFYPLSASAVTLYISSANSTISTIENPTGLFRRSVFTTDLNNPFGLAFDANGILFVADANTGNINKFTPSGDKTVFAIGVNSGINTPRGLAFDASGNLYVADSSSNAIKKISPTGTVTNFATGLSSPRGLAFDVSGNLFVTTNSGTIDKFTPSGARTVFASGLTDPFGLAFDRSGSLFVADRGTSTIDKFTPSGVKTVFAKDNDGLDAPIGLAFQDDGTLFASTFNSAQADSGLIRLFNTNGSQPAFAFAIDRPTFIAFDSGLVLKPTFIPTEPPVSTAVPEPFTVIGTLVGGTAAIRMRKKLKSTGEE